MEIEATIGACPQEILQGIAATLVRHSQSRHEPTHAAFNLVGCILCRDYCRLTIRDVKHRIPPFLIFAKSVA